MGLFDKIEEKRKAFIASQNKSGYGTFSGLADTIRKRQLAALKAKAQQDAEDASNVK